jgi:hypothetical protein
MSEWLASQKKPIGDFTKLPQDRIYKANHRNLKLIKEEQQKLENLNEILDKM